MRQRICFTGRVQGVGFRATARGICRRYPVTGFVLNQPDASVLLEIQGDPGDIDAALAELRLSMKRNIVSETITPLADLPGEIDFSIRA